MPYRIKGTLKLPSGQPAAGVDIEFISRRNYSPLLMDLSSIIKTTSTGAYDITLEYGEYAVVVYWGCNQPSHIGKLFVFSDTAAGLDLQTLLQQADWQPATPEYIQQIQDWLAQSGKFASQAADSAAVAKTSEIAVEADRAEVASNKTIVVNAQADVSAKAADVTMKAAQVATNTATVNEKTPLAISAADTASQKAVDAAASDASARDAATRAENAAMAMTGAILDGGECDLSSGFYPQPLTVNGQKYSTVWYVKVGGTVGGVTYDAGDKLQYTTANNGFYFRIDARDDVVSVNGKKGAVTLNAQDVGADPAGAASSLIDRHATKAGAHPINGVYGLDDALNGRVSKIIQLADGVDLNTVIDSGFYRLSSSAMNAPAGFSVAYGLLQVIRGNDTITQTITGYLDGRRASRSGSPANVGGTGKYTQWYEIYAQNSILGQVSQLAGVPTGAIIERGSNDNGEYIKWADGTMICYRRASIEASCTLPYGAVLYTGSVTWTFPARFISPPVTPPPGIRLGTGASWAVQFSATPTEANYYVVDAASRPAGTQAEFVGFAIGRWF